MESYIQRADLRQIAKFLDAREMYFAPDKARTVASRNGLICCGSSVWIEVTHIILLSNMKCHPP